MCSGYVEVQLVAFPYLKKEQKNKPNVICFLMLQCPRHNKPSGVKGVVTASNHISWQ